MTDDVRYALPPEQCILDGRDTPPGPFFDERALEEPFEPLVLSILAVGVQIPVIVCARDGRYFVIDGRRRVINAREANKRLGMMGEKAQVLPVIIKGARLSDETAAMLGVLLNEHRKSDELQAKMRKAKRLLDSKLDIRTVAGAFGHDPNTIRNWIAVLSCHPDVLAAVNLGIIATMSAAALAGLPRELQPKALDKLLAESNKPTFRRATALTRAVRNNTRLGAPLPKNAVRRVLATAGRFEPEFLRGVRFAKGLLGAEEVQEILEKVKA